MTDAAPRTIGDAVFAPSDADEQGGDADDASGDAGLSMDDAAPAMLFDAGQSLDPGCGPGLDPEADRVVLIGYPFGPRPGVNGQDISGMTLRNGQTLLNNGMRLDVGDRPVRIVFVPWGRFALVLGEAGTLTSVATPSAGDLAIIDTVPMPNLGSAELVLSPDGRRVHVLRTDVDEGGGVYTVEVGCDGTLTPLPMHFSLRLVQGFGHVPGRPDTAVLVGGQAVFEPIDDDDIRLLRWGVEGWTQVAAFDVFSDFIDAGAIGFSGDGRLVVVPNGAPFSEEGGQVSVLALEADQLTEVARLRDMVDARQARFAPDGTTLLLSRFEPGRMTIFRAEAGGLTQTDELVAPLADHFAFVRGGTDEGRVVVPSIHPVNGPQIIVMRVTAPGAVIEEQTLLLGPGAQQIPGAVGVQ